MKIKRIVQYLIIVPVTFLCATCGDVTSGKRIACSCPAQGDWNDDGLIRPLDVSFAVNYVYMERGFAPPSDSHCPAINRGDWDCDGDIDTDDIDLMVEYVYSEPDLHPCDPCECDPYPEGCPEYPQSGFLGANPVSRSRINPKFDKGLGLLFKR